MLRHATRAAIVILTFASSAAAQAVGVVIDGPPPPIAPATITRDDKGHATIRAVRVDTPIRVDGRLDEEVYASIPRLAASFR